MLRNNLLSPRLRLWARGLFGVLVLLVIIVSVAPSNSVPQVGSDKLGHLMAYACLQIVGMIAFPAPRHVIGVAVGLLLLGASLEIVQSFIPSRSAEWLDLAANAAGVALGVAGYILFSRGQFGRPR